MSIKDDGVYLIDGTRTAIGAYGGSLAHTRPDDMAATIIRGLLQRHPAAEADLDEVVLAAPTSPAKTTATSPAWRRCFPGWIRRCLPSPSTAFAPPGWMR